MESLRAALGAVDAAISDGASRSVAILGAALVLAVAMYFASERVKAMRLQKHWERVCTHTLKERDSLDQKVLLQTSADTPQAQVSFEVTRNRFGLLGLGGCS